jgi:hypothetical protein
LFKSRTSIPRPSGTKSPASLAVVVFECVFELKIQNWRSHTDDITRVESNELKSAGYVPSERMMRANIMREK